MLRTLRRGVCSLTHQVRQAPSIVKPPPIKKAAPNLPPLSALFEIPTRSLFSDLLNGRPHLTAGNRTHMYRKHFHVREPLA